MEDRREARSRRARTAARRATAIGLVLAVAGCAAAASEVASTPPAAAGPPADAAPSATVLAGVYTGDQAARGQREFQQTCASCHSANEFAGPIFQRIWTDRSVGELYEVISTMMPQNDPGSLSAREYTDIITFFLRQNGYPEGELELAADPAVLRRIVFRPAP